MKTEKTMLAAFLLNAAFAVFELIGGIITGSIAVASDAVHDVGDALAIGISYFLERKSHEPPDKTHTFGHARYAVLGGMMSALILLFGSGFVVSHAISRLWNPTDVHSDGMAVLAVIGIGVNGIAALLTHKGESFTQKATYLHMAEDVLGWVVVLIGAVVMRLTDIAWIDPLLSIGVSGYIIIHAVKLFASGITILAERVPKNLNIERLQEAIKRIDGVEDVHHMHLWSLTEDQHCATMHIVISGQPPMIKQAVRETLRQYEVGHVTIEVETTGEECLSRRCDSIGQHAHCHHH